MAGRERGLGGEREHTQVVGGRTADGAEIGVGDRHLARLGLLRGGGTALAAVGENHEAFDDAGIAAAHAFGSAEAEAHVAGADDDDGGAGFVGRSHGPAGGHDLGGHGFIAGGLGFEHGAKFRGIERHVFRELEIHEAFVDGIDPALLDRAVRRAYLSETDNSYAIERESATNDKREAFASLLARAHEAEQLTEDYLVALQNLTITSPLDKAFEFRSKQNWLRKDLPGALGVTYVPPPPDLNLEIMDEIMSFANNPGTGVDALVRGAVTSFAFVFAHPFMDGNGRLSRFLFHKAACQDPRLANGLVLPVSVAMKRNEGDYLKALESFSKKTRRFWKVNMIDELVKAEFTGAPEIYRYWDGTECVEFGLRMAQEALDRDLQNESVFLQRFDQAYRAVNDAVDMNNDDLVLMIRSVLQNNGVLSNNRRKQLIGKGHPTAIIDKAMAVLTECLADDDEARPAPVALS